MTKRDYCLCENKGADQLRSNCEADQRLCFCYSDTTVLFYLNLKFQASSCPSACSGRFVSDLFGNHIVGFPTRQLIYQGHISVRTFMNGYKLVTRFTVPNMAQHVPWCNTFLIRSKPFFPLSQNTATGQG